MIRTREAGTLRAEDARHQVVLAGWVARRRDHGGVAFIDLRDASGVVQVVIRDAAAYGMILMQGHGKMGVWDIDTPALIRYGQLTFDEFFVSEDAAKAGVKITNPSATDPLVMLKHFGPENPDLVL